MSDYTEADLEPERQLQHIKNLQRQVETLYELNTRLTERVTRLEEQTAKDEKAKAA